MNKRILFCLTAFLLLYGIGLGQTVLVSGRVTSSVDQTPIKSATIKQKDGNAATTTDENGRFELSIPTNSTLIITSVGFEPIEVPVEGRRQVDIVLQQGNSSLDQVVVVGYGTQRKKDLTGAVVSISGSDLRQVPAANAIKSMQGMVAGVDIASPNNNPNSTPVIRIRGNRSINAGNDPLIVVDGLPFGGSLNDLNSGDIKSIEVLKDASATAIYGSRGATSNRSE